MSVQTGWWAMLAPAPWRVAGAHWAAEAVLLQTVSWLGRGVEGGPRGVGSRAQFWPNGQRAPHPSALHTETGPYRAETADMFLHHGKQQVILGSGGGKSSPDFSEAQPSSGQALGKAFFFNHSWRTWSHCLLPDKKSSVKLWKLFIQHFTIYKGLSLTLSHFINTTVLLSRLNSYYFEFYRQGNEGSETLSCPRVRNSWVAALGFMALFLLKTMLPTLQLQKKKSVHHFGNTLIFHEKSFKQFQNRPHISQKGKDSDHKVSWGSWNVLNGLCMVYVCLFHSLLIHPFILQMFVKPGTVHRKQA